MHYWLVMPAAGVGRRFGGAKQFATLAERTVIELALQPFVDDARCQGGAVALSSDEPRRAHLAALLPPHFALIDGGTTRAHSVLNGLLALGNRAAETDWMLVHDAARPCLSSADLARLLTGAEGSDGALLAAPVADTVKQARSAPAGIPPHCEATIPRESLWLAQTPQMFRLGALRAALELSLAEGRMPTDEAQAMEWQGVSARLIEARDSNIKITNAADLTLARAILRGRQGAPE
jgi:2-C-methyl-D-erythritol 4-phosphate cytidylyltransferase